MTQGFPHGYAVIIGVDQNNVPRLALPTVAEDVRALYEVLTHPQRCGYPAENVQLLQGAQATQKNILEALYRLQEKVAADPEATAIVYYSGHGMVDTYADQYYLIPYDIQALERVRLDAIRAETFAAQLDDVRPPRLLVILDCCHAAGVDAKEAGQEGSAERLARRAFPLSLAAKDPPPLYEPHQKDLSLLAQGRGRAVLNSSTGEQSSYLRNDGAMSLFTYHLIEALTGHAPYDEGDAAVLVTDVMSYVTRRVAATAQREGRIQTPVMRTTGVFPVALILGGEGLAKGQHPPDPLQPLPPVDPGSTTITFNQQGQAVHGPQVNAGGDAHIGQIGDNISTGGGDFAGRDASDTESNH
ncbi:MAG TPA: caspase family protein [Candidatus Sulfomarinibacteraceae bacterium]|nr:caspase family protein [Candidatus Sulfomarinibacteraceae bacterium]